VKNLETMILLGHCLAPGRKEGNDILAQQLVSTGMDWKRLIQIASGHFLAPSLCQALQQRGLWDDAPTEIRELLQAMALLNQERDDLHYRELVVITKQLNAIGLEPLLLKGAICLVLSEQFPGARSRVMGDLDLLLPDGHAQEALESIMELGYVYHPILELDWYKDHRHLPPLYHPEDGVRLEIHRDLNSSREKPVLDLRQTWRNARPVTLDGAHALVPDHYSRMLHNVVNTRLNDRHHSDFRLDMRQLNEWVQLRDIHDNKSDWLRMWKRFDRFGEGSVLETYCLAAERFFGQPLPEGIEPSRAAIRTERIMCLALRGPVWSFFLNSLKRKLRYVLKPSAYVQKYQKIRNERTQKNHLP
jgi:hypothetical protein